MPSSTVTMNPPGSLPGMINFASAPTTSPKTIHERMAIIGLSSSFPPLEGGCKRLTTNSQEEQPTPRPCRRDDEKASGSDAGVPEQGVNPVGALQLVDTAEREFGGAGAFRNLAE